MTNGLEVRIQLYREDEDREGGEDYDKPERDHRYGANVDTLIDGIVGGADNLDRSEATPSHENAQDVRINLHEFGPEVIALIGALVPVISALTPLLVAWIQKPTREIQIYKGDKVVASGNLTPDEVQQILDKLGRQE